MKFAKELEDDLVPEWRAKYINYKQGKKRIKAISKALRKTNQTSHSASRPQLTHTSSAASIPYTHYDFISRVDRKAQAQAQNGGAQPALNAQQLFQASRKMSTTMFTTSPPIQGDSRQESSSDDGNENEDDNDDSESDGEERTPLKRITSGQSYKATPKNYGSISPTDQDDPVSIPSAPNGTADKIPKLNLPDPAIDPSNDKSQPSEPPSLQNQRSMSDRNDRVTQLKDVDRPEQRKHHSVPLVKQIVQKKLQQQVQQAGNSSASPNKPSARDRFKRIFQAKQINSPDVSNAQQQAYNELDYRQDDFFDFLDRELNKIEKFYRSKEDEARDRLHDLRAQLHEHRDQRARDIEHQRQGKKGVRRQDGDVSDVLHETPLPNMPLKEISERTQNGTLFKKALNYKPKIGKTSKAMEELASPAASPKTQAMNDRKDYTKRKPAIGNEKVPHKFAKRRLKLAMQEFYRGMELLKSYVLLNRTGFRKINKKYDKAVNARPPLRYLNEKISNAYFVKSTRIEEYLVAVEDLYARYFERGNRKVAVNKLRSKLRAGDHSASTFRNGVFLAAGAGLGMAGLKNASDMLFNADPIRSTVTSYLLQMYAGYFLALLLFLLFVLDCRIWTTYRINYIFVFEYDTRHVHDWRQLAEIPCFLLFLNGLIIWLNFEFGDQNAMYRYWPIVLFSLTIAVMAFPAKTLYYHSRKWWGYSNARLFFAGFNPVEFRDFFLGDMYCSETYTMAQIAVFFCVYGGDWRNPARCNSTNSWVPALMTCLPALARLMQCLRRFRDSGNWFPHIANGAKYGCNILYYGFLGVYRMHVNEPNHWKYKIAFIVLAAINGLYCSLWDVCMDWSLGNFFSKNRGLRDQLAFRKKRYYYFAIVTNVVLRHQWIVYAVFTEDLQHSAFMSFLVALAEVLRRGLWSIFRVENEHTNNVAHFRASRDVPLPYSLPQSGDEQEQGQQQDGKPKSKRKSSTGLADGDRRKLDQDGSGRTTGADHDLERQTTQDSNQTGSTGSGIRKTPALRALQRVGTVIAAAHSQDFQKRRRPAIVGDDDADDEEDMINSRHGRGGDSSDEEEEDEDHEIEASLKGDSDNGDDYEANRVEAEGEVDEARRLTLGPHEGESVGRNGLRPYAGQTSEGESSGSSSSGDKGKGK